jgi:hypothetical protein
MRRKGAVLAEVLRTTLLSELFHVRRVHHLVHGPTSCTAPLRARPPQNKIELQRQDSKTACILLNSIKF